MTEVERKLRRFTLLSEALDKGYHTHTLNMASDMNVQLLAKFVFRTIGISGEGYPIVDVVDLWHQLDVVSREEFVSYLREEMLK